MSDRVDKFTRLWANTKPDKPLEDLSLYVQSKRSAADLVFEKLEAAVRAGTEPRDKHLLLGARGVGKSTELRRLAQLLVEDGRFIVETVDLDATGITASAVSAADVLYLSGVALLGRLARDDKAAANALFARLKTSYAPEIAEDLGALGEAVGGLRGFGALAGTVAGAAAGQPAAGGAIGKAVGGVVRAGIALLPGRAAPLQESTPAGRHFLDTCAEITRAVTEREPKPICLLFDGLEKMNGVANARFRAVFRETRLIAEAPWSMVIATPPSTLTVGSTGSDSGYQPTIVWGFPDQPELLAELVQRRRKAGELPETAIPRDAIDAMVAMCGGLPRHLMVILKEAVWATVIAESDRLDVSRAEEGVVALGRELAMGLDRTGKRILREVHRSGDLPEQVEGATSLFGDGKILAEPPRPVEYRYRVHPILAKYILDAEPG